MTKRVIPTIAALLMLSATVLAPAPAAARSKTWKKNKRNLKLWDRVLYKRYERAQKLAAKAQQHASRGRYKKAVALLHRALKIRPYAASLWFSLGTVHSYAGTYKACTKAMLKARKLDAKHKKNLTAFRLGLCYSMTNRISLGVTEYKKVYASRWITGAVLNWNMADNYMALGRLKEAAHHYRRSLRSNPGQRVLHFALAVALDRAGKLRSADLQLRRANRLDPTGSSINDKEIIWLPSHDHLYYRALRAYSLGRRGEALHWWQKFIRAAPQSPWDYVIRQRATRLRTGAYTAREVSLDKGKADPKLLAAALSAALPALRKCLGSAATPPPLTSLKGVRLGLEAGRRGVTRVTVIKRYGNAPSPTACVRTALRKTRWTKILKKPVSFSFSLVGP